MFLVDRINFVPNPSFEVDTSGWYSAMMGTLSVTNSEFYTGTSSASLTSGMGFLLNGDYLNLPSDKTYTASLYVKGSATNLSINLYKIALDFSNTEIVSSTPINLDGSWQRISITTLLQSGWDAKVTISSDSTSSPVFVDGVMVEESPTAGTYFDGSTPGASWSGTPHSSTSSMPSGPTTYNKNFKVKNGLEVLGTSATVNGNQVLTTASSFSSLADVSDTSPNPGDTIIFDLTTSKYIPIPAPAGPEGPAGASAYEVAVSNGFVGTEQEWLESLVGPAGSGGGGIHPMF